jgi:hypothetical protein
MQDRGEEAGYASRFLSLAYAVASPLYDLDHLVAAPSLDVVAVGINQVGGVGCVARTRRAVVSASAGRARGMEPIHGLPGRGSERDVPRASP